MTENSKATKTKKSNKTPGLANPRRSIRNRTKQKNYPTIKVQLNDEQTIELPQYVTMAPGRIIWKDPRSEISLNIADYNYQYAELYEDMDLSVVIASLYKYKTLIPFNPKEDKLPLTKANSIDKNADVSVLRNDDAWVTLQSTSERQVMNEIRRVTDQTNLERMFKYETNGMNPLHKARSNIVDLLLGVLKKKGSLVVQSLVKKEETEEIQVKT